MEYSKILKQAFEHTKKYRSMWWLGMLVVSGGGGFSNSIPTDFGDSVGPSSTDIDRFTNAATSWAVEYWYILVMIGVLLLALMLLSFILHYIATAGLYIGANQARLGKRPTLKGMFKAGTKPFWRVVGLHLLVGLANVVFIAIPLVIIVLIGITIVGLIIAIPAFIIFLIALFPFTAVVSILKTYATQYVVLDDANIMDSLRNAWQLFRSKLGDSAVMFLLSAVIAIGIGVVTIGIVLLLCIPFAIIGFIAYNASGWIPVIVVAAVGLAILCIVLLIIKGIKQTYFFNLWHLTFAELKGK